MEKIIHKLINDFTEGVDTYTHNGSTWLIFTESKQWVIELTDAKTLWYNYNFFNGIFSYTSMDVVENQQYITKWVEDNIINKVKHTVTANNHIFDRVEDAIQNGVKKTKGAKMKTDWSVDDTLENGVKETNYKIGYREKSIEDSIKNGVKHTYIGGGAREVSVEKTLQNGVKETQFNSYENKSWVEGVIKGGVKETNHVDVMKFFDNKMETAIQDGVKITAPLQSREYTGDINEVLGNGVRTSRPRQYVGGDIVDKVIDKGVIETHDDVYHHKGRIDGVIKNGVKETKTPGNGDLVSYVEWMEENNSNSYPKMIDDVIENGVKETKSDDFNLGQSMVDKVIDEGIKIKNPTD